MTLQSTSQAGQDVFAWKMCGEKTNGSFLDVGSYNNALNSNSYALERIGWYGLLIDILIHEQSVQRASPFLKADAVTIDWVRAIEDANMYPQIDYLSLDVDDATLPTLERFPLQIIRFNVITIEHDAYRMGNGPRDRMREILTGWGYDIVCKDVKIRYPEQELNPFEDWYVSPFLSGRPIVEKARCEGVEWSEIIRRLG